MCFLIKGKEVAFTARNSKHATKQAMAIYLASFTRKRNPHQNQAFKKRAMAIQAERENKQKQDHSPRKEAA